MAGGRQLIKQATDVLNRMFVLASKNPRNYIIDQVRTLCTVHLLDGLLMGYAFIPCPVLQVRAIGWGGTLIQKNCGTG